MKLILILISLFLLLQLRVYSQSDSVKYLSAPNYKFGEVSEKDFDVSPGVNESGAGAVVLADIGIVDFEENVAGDRDIIMKRYLRVKILSNTGMDAGRFEIFVNTYAPYHNFMVSPPKPGLEILQGSTYNIEKGNIVETKLEMGNIFSDKTDKIHEIKKFVMPALRAGSVFEIRYTVRENMMAAIFQWNFQTQFPCRWSEYDVTIPNGHHFAVKYLGDSSYYIQSNEVKKAPAYGVYTSYNLLTNHLKWVKRNEPGFVNEPYAAPPACHIDQVKLLRNFFTQNMASFANSYIPPETRISFSQIYFMVNNLGDFETDNYHWLKKDAEKIAGAYSTNFEKTKAVYKYVRNFFTCSNRHFYFPSQSLKVTFNSKKGNEADINLLLTAMLRSLKIEADPAVLTTIDRGYASLAYSIGTDYNYLICIANLNGTDIALDASYPENSFGKLESALYNQGAATLNTRNSRIVPLLRDSLTDINHTAVIIGPDEKMKFSGSFIHHFGTLTSGKTRSQIKMSSQHQFFDSLILKTRIANLSAPALDNFEDPEKPLIAKGEFELPGIEKTEILYLNPVIFPDFEINPFNNPDRKYPVELPWKPDYIYTLSLDIPAGYQVDEMPSPFKIDFNEGDGFFEYSIEKNEDNIQLKTEFKLKKTFFPVEEYKGLRDFVSSIIKKENEQIVFRKKQ